MGLDVYLYQFIDLDTDAILKLSKFSEELWAFEEFEKRKAMPQSERDSYPTEQNWMKYREKLSWKAHELGLPEGIVGT